MRAWGVPARTSTVDEFLAGDPNTAVTGIATTMMATMDVLQRAVAQQAQLIVTHEPVFWDHHNQAIDALVRENDQVYAKKVAYIEKNGLVIWHLHDALHDMRPDLVDLGTLSRLGWPLPQDLTYPAILSIEPVRLADLAAHLAKRLDASSARYIGDPNLHIARVGLALGFRGAETVRHLLHDPDIDAVIMGEGHEWEIGAYAADAVSLGFHKALIILGHIPSEQYGMVEATRLIQEALPTIPVTFIPCRDPYWAVDDL